tara:strand:+ start:232 stop:393 length:162 start_codon:yes stop_codon:yes gene_type:complete
MFSKKKEESAPVSAPASGGETFACDGCGQTRPESQKKEQEHSEEESKNVCEFC